MTSSILSGAIWDFRRTWPQLAVTDLLFKLVAFIILGPLAALMLRVFLALSGSSVLADEDILYFFFKPLGWVTLIVVGGVSVAIIALEQASLMTIALGATHDRRVDYLEALRHTATRAVPVFRLTAYLVARTLILLAPFLVAAGLVYLTLLTKFDINYYLGEKPPVFWIAAILIALIAGAGAVVLARCLIGWAFSLPMVLFEGVGARQSLRQSRERVALHRRMIARVLIGWAAASLLLSICATGLIGALGRFMIPLLSDRVGLLALGIGTLLLVWGLVNLFVTVAVAAAFGLMTVRLYRSTSDGAAGDELGSEPLADGAGWGIRRKSLLWGLLVLFLVAVAAGGLLLRGFQLEEHVAVTAHRGAAGAAPENTLAAVERAIADGTDWVEIDVQENADGEVIVVHDSDFMKLAGVDLKVWEATREELQDIDVGTWFAPEFKDQRVPTLAQVLDLCKGKARVNIELKYYGHDERLEERVVEIVEARDMASEVRVMSLDYEGVKKLETLRPDWETGVLTAVAVGDLTKLEVDFLAVNASIVTRRFVRAAHASGKEVHAWTVNDAVGMSQMMSRGVDNLITDEPALANTVRAERAEMSSAERLLVALAIYFGAGAESSDPAEDLEG